MSKALETIKKVVQEIAREDLDCGVLTILGDCGKCPYLVEDEDVCDKLMKKEMKDLLSGSVWDVEK